MFCFSLNNFANRVCVFISFLIFLVLVILAPSSASAQRAENDPLFTDFKGVRIGMTADEARKKLGSPRDKGDEQDFYVFGETQAVQVFYDKTGKVSAISVDYMSGANGIPTAKEVLGAEADKKPDGALYKMIRYPKAGYWVSYSRTAGDSPTTTVTMQKIEH